MKNILQYANSIKSVLINDRRTIHKYPEIGLDLPKTTSYVMKRLQEMGYEPKEISKSGVVATIGEGPKTILLRADMDALPAKENTDLPFKSTNSNAHLCGHDMHTSMLLGVAQILRNFQSDLKGTVKLMFQPGEEYALGAKEMIKAGVLENVDIAMALHVDSQMEVGKLSYTKGPCTASMDSFIIEVQGKGAHSSTPHLGVDPLMIVNSIYTTLNTLVSKEINPSETAILVIGKMGGGTLLNIIPDTATIEGALRSFNPEVSKYIVKRIDEIVEQTTKSLRGTYTYKLKNSTPSTINNPDLCDSMHGFIEDILGNKNVEILESPFYGTEDMSYISMKVPTMLAWLGAGEPNNYSLHNPNIILDENALPLGSSVLANCALEWLKLNYQEDK